MISRSMRLIAAIVLLGYATPGGQTSSAAATKHHTNQRRVIFHPKKRFAALTNRSPRADVLLVKLTAYHSQNCIDNPRRGLTATGESACNTHGIAADWRLLPPGTLLDIPGVGIRKVDDTGIEMQRAGKNGIYHLDVRMRTYREARAFGVKWVYARLLR